MEHSTIVSTSPHHDDLNAQPRPAHGESASDLAGDALADQIQELLDEAAAASAATSPADSTATAQSSGEIDKSHSSAETELNNHHEAVETDAVTFASPGEVEEEGVEVKAPLPVAMKALDSALAESADSAMTGDFETVDDVLHADAPKVAAVAPPSAIESPVHESHETATAHNESGGAGDEGMLEGSMESFEEALAEVSAPAPAVAVAVAPSVAPSTPIQAAPIEPPVAAPVAAAVVASVAAVVTPSPVAAPATKPTSAPAPAPKASPAPAPATESKPAAPRRSIDPLAPLIAVLAIVNRPFMSLTQTQRDLMGFIGVQMAGAGISMIVGVRFGQMMGFATFSGMMIPLAWMLYSMFLRGPANQAPATSTAAAATP